MRVTCTLLYSLSSCSNTRVRARRRVEHQVLADQPARVREPCGNMAFADISSSRGVSAPLARQDDGFRFLQPLALVAIEVAHAGRASALVGDDLHDVALGADFAAAGRFGFRNHRRQRRRLRADLAAEAVAEAAVNARRTAAIVLRVDRQRRGERMQAQLARAALEQHAGGLHRQRRHRIRLAARRIERARARQPDTPISHSTFV